MGKFVQKTKFFRDLKPILESSEDTLMINVESMLEDIRNSLPMDEVNDQNNTNQSSNNQDGHSSRPLTPVVSDTKA